MSFSDLLGGLFGGKTPSPDWKAIERLMQMELEGNRTDRHGIFGGWTWDDEKQAQTQYLAEGMQPGANRLMARASGGVGLSDSPYRSPMQFDKLLQAKLANQYDRHGITGLPGGGQIPSWREGYGPQLKNQNLNRMANQDYGGWMPPPPPGEQGPGQTPGRQPPRSQAALWGNAKRV